VRLLSSAQQCFLSNDTRADIVKCSTTENDNVVIHAHMHKVEDNIARMSFLPRRKFVCAILFMIQQNFLVTIVIVAFTAPIHGLSTAWHVLNELRLLHTHRPCPRTFSSSLAATRTCLINAIPVTARALLRLCFRRRHI
jgi:hypothetical protein